MNGVPPTNPKKPGRARTIRPRGDIMMKGSIKADRMQTVCRLRADSVKATQRGAAFLRPLRVLYKVGTIGDLTDGQLLERFATDAGPAAELAFSALVERHEAMVWRVCMAIVRDEHAAEDAFQATFLVLVRKAGSLWVSDSLGPWLHQVACRTASCMRSGLIRRRKHERRFATRNGVDPVLYVTPRDFDRDAALHEEVNRLPEKYRAPLILCDLEGRTHQEAARCLGWPIGTVKSRQSSGRGLLRERLLRRGLGLGLASAVVESLRQTSIAATPNAASQTAVNAAMQQSARLLTAAHVSTRVLIVTQEVIRAMFWIRVQFLATLATSVIVVSGTAGAVVFGSQEPERKLSQPVGNPQAKETSATSQPKRSKVGNGQPAQPVSRAMLRAQQLATRRAKALYEIARQNRELAEIAAEEFEDVIYPRELQLVEGQVKLAESDLARSEDRLEWAKRMFDKKYVSQAQKVSEELSHKKAVFELEKRRAQSSC